MSFYIDRIYPRLISMLGNPKPIRDIRQEIIPLAHGIVLEIGAGTGANFVHYNPARVSRLFALEPNQEMIRRAKQQRQPGLAVEFIDLPGERIPLADGSVDTVVSTFTLGTIPDVAKAMRGIGRVLKPGGELIFFELGLAPDPHIQRWQVRLEPLMRWMFGGLYLTRDIPALLAHAGFQVKQIKRAYLATFPKPLTYCCWGTAQHQSR